MSCSYYNCILPLGELGTHIFTVDSKYLCQATRHECLKSLNLCNDNISRNTNTCADYSIMVILPINTVDTFVTWQPPLAMYSAVKLTQSLHPTISIHYWQTGVSFTRGPLLYNHTLCHVRRCKAWKLLPLQEIYLFITVLTIIITVLTSFIKWVSEWYQSLTAHQHQKDHTVPKQV